MITAISGSPRKEGNTELGLNIILDHFKEKGYKTKLVRLCENEVLGCTACLKCKENKDGKCYGRKDDFNQLNEQILVSQAIILGSPVYFGSATPELKSFIDRAGYVNRAYGNALRYKIGGSVVVARRAGHNFTTAQINYFFHIMEMVQIGSTYWNVGFGGSKGEINNDDEAVKTLNQYAENLEWLINKLYK